MLGNDLFQQVCEFHFFSNQNVITVSTFCWMIWMFSSEIRQWSAASWEKCLLVLEHSISLHITMSLSVYWGYVGKTDSLCLVKWVFGVFNKFLALVHKVICVYWECCSCKNIASKEVNARNCEKKLKSQICKIWADTNTDGWLYQGKTETD